MCAHEPKAVASAAPPLALACDGPAVVTGGSGFLGGEVVRLLLEGGCHDVRIVDTQPPPAGLPGQVRAHRLDLRWDDLAPAFAGARVVVHLAACQYHTPLAPTTYGLPFQAVNVEGTRRVLAAAVAAGAETLVHVSTNMVYGLPRSLPLREDHPLEPLGPYGRTKLEAERLVAAAQGSFARTIVVRPGLLVGPGRVGVIGRILEWVLRNRPIPLIGDGRNRYEVMAAEDCARLALQAARGPEGHAVYNCASAHVPSMREWIAAVIREAGSRSFIVGTPGRLLKPALRALEAAHLSPLRLDQYEIADRDYYQSADLARDRLGWSPRWTGTDAALATFHWYRGARARRDAAA